MSKNANGATREGAQNRSDHISCGRDEERLIEEAAFQMGLPSLRKEVVL